MEKEDTNKINVEVEISGIDENIKKAEKLVSLLKEAKSLADDLASVNLDVGFKS